MLSLPALRLTHRSSAVAGQADYRDGRVLDCVRFLAHGTKGLYCRFRERFYSIFSWTILDCKILKFSGLHMNSTLQRSFVVDSYVLSPLQHGMLFHQLQSGRETGVDVEQLVATIKEDLDQDIFNQSWKLTADRHPILRTRFAWQDLGRPEQHVLASVDVQVSCRDLRAVSADEQAAQAEAFLVDDRRRGFDLGEAPLWRVTLWRMADAQCRMVWTYSHAILDGCYA